MTLHIEKLKQLAKQVKRAGGSAYLLDAFAEYRAATNPQAILELIDRLEKAEKFNLMLKAAFSEIGYSVKETEHGLEYLKQ